MDIKESSNLKFVDLVLCKNRDLIGFILFPTIGLWLGGFILSIIISTMFVTETIFLDIMTRWIGFGSSAGVATAIFDLIGISDWNYECGKEIWLKVVGYNLVVFTIVTGLHNGIGMDKIIEPATSVVFTTTDIDDCNQAIKLKSKNMNYVYCEGFSSSISNSDNIKANIIGYKRYGTFVSDHVEFIEREVVLN